MADALRRRIFGETYMPSPSTARASLARLQGKVAVISGTSGGIGAATAHRLADEGAAVVLADINLPGAEQTARAVRETGGEAFAHYLDLAVILPMVILPVSRARTWLQLPVGL
jgi:hypothetical protein